MKRFPVEQPREPDPQTDCGPERQGEQLEPWVQVILDDENQARRRRGLPPVYSRTSG